MSGVRLCHPSLPLTSLLILTPKGCVTPCEQLITVSLRDTDTLLRTEIPKTCQPDFLPSRTFKYTTKLVLEFKFL